MKQFLVLLFVVTSAIAHSQSFKVNSLVSEQTKSGKITGIILDNEVANEPLAFATVEVKDTNLSTTTELDGSFSFNLKPGTYTLVYSFIGYKTIEVNDVEVTSNKELKVNQQLSALTPSMPILVSQLK